MKLHILTIVLNGMPFLPMQLACFNRLRCDWTWHIVEGPAANVNCTSWCKPQNPGLSTDGSHEFIQLLDKHPRCHVRWSQYWHGGKVEMCNAGIEHITEPCVLMQIDVDELWTPEQIDRITATILSRDSLVEMQFFCRYFVGPNIVTIGENCYGNNPGEWARAWSFIPGMQFKKHEPPIWNAHVSERRDREVTRETGLVFDHWAYVFESQVAYKQRFYGYKDAVKHWMRLQNHPGPWPVKLKDFLPWTDGHAQATLLHKP